MNHIGGWKWIHEESTEFSGDAKVTCCHFEWKIDSFDSLKNVRIFSEYFQFYNIHWRMQMSWANPNERTTKILIFLQREPSSTAMIVDTTIGFKRSDGSIFHAVRKVLEIHDTCIPFPPMGNIFSIPVSEWKDVELQNDSLTVICILNFSVTSVSDTTCPPKSDFILVKNLEDLFQSERDADVTIRVKGKRFKAHRPILVARSTVFATMFQHDMAERRMGEVDIDDCNPDSFRDFLVYLYTGKTDRVTPDNARGLYITADKYAVEELKENCSKCLSLALSIDSIFDVLVLATMHNDSKLLKSATDFFVKNFKQILESPNWLEFHSKNFNLVHELLLKTADYVNA